MKSGYSNTAQNTSGVSEPIIKGKQLVDSGILGKITMVKPMWNWNIAKELDNTPLPGKLDWQRFLGGARDHDLRWTHDARAERESRPLHLEHRLVRRIV